MDELLVEVMARMGTTAWRKQAARDVTCRILLAHTLGTRARHTFCGQKFTNSTLFDGCSNIRLTSIHLTIVAGASAGQRENLTKISPSAIL